MLKSSKSNFICRFSANCPIYQGTEKPNSTPLHIYQNVFCKRGIKGWKNCDQFLAYEKENTES